jgi:hypothetical protein
VEGVAEDEDAGTPRRRARDLHRILDRFRAARHQEAALLGAAARRELGQQATDLDIRLVHTDHEALVQVAVELLPDGRSGEPVTGVLAAEPAGEVDVRASVHVLDPGSFGARHDEWWRGDTARDVPLAGRNHRFRRGLLADRHVRREPTETVSNLSHP